MLFDPTKPDQFDIASVRELTAATSDDHRVHVMQGRLGRLFAFSADATHGIQQTRFTLAAVDRAMDGDMLIVEDRPYMLFDVQKIAGYNNAFRAHAIAADVATGIGHPEQPRFSHMPSSDLTRRYG